MAQYLCFRFPATSQLNIMNGPTAEVARPSRANNHLETGPSSNKQESNEVAELPHGVCSSLAIVPFYLAYLALGPW